MSINCVLSLIWSLSYFVIVIASAPFNIYFTGAKVISTTVWDYSYNEHKWKKILWNVMANSITYY